MRTAIEVRDLNKTFRVPHHRVDSLKERMLHPLDQGGYDDLHALREVSFDVEQGEFFGIVGRNGSGKSTLLKILASIYGASSGRIRMAGTLAPFIELGVGFNMDLTSRENIVLNGVMMGLSRQEAASRIDSVLEFAELEEHVELKLKNYSSGMLVRLAFSVMLQAETDILLIDEVLAVGDAAFQQKCTDVFNEMRDSGRTVILVTHDMAAVNQFCHRAMLLDHGELDLIGDPQDVARRYLTLNFASSSDGFSAADGGETERAASSPEIRLVETWLETAEGRRTENVEQGEVMTLRATFEAVRDVAGPAIGFLFSDSNGVNVFDISQDPRSDAVPDLLEAGQRIHFCGRVETRIATGRYDVRCWVGRNRNYQEPVLYVPHALDLVVFGQRKLPGVVDLDHEIDVEVVGKPPEAG